jgi:hypothetical protein
MKILQNEITGTQTSFFFSSNFDSELTDFSFFLSAFAAAATYPLVPLAISTHVRGNNHLILKNSIQQMQYS